MTAMIREFFKLESAGGILLVIAAVVAMVIANSDLSMMYNAVLHYPVFEMSVLHWINDGLMAVFFLLIGLEVKRELVEGALKSKDTALFPAIAALGGMIAPAVVFTFINASDPIALKGWAVSAATDIAFALGIMALLGKRVPISLKVFLLALAIIDDLGVIAIIAVFYSGDLSAMALLIGAVTIGLLVLMNVMNVANTYAYLVVGTILWAAVLKSGVHATLAGVIVGFAIPLSCDGKRSSPLKTLEHQLHPYVAYGILPLFAFVNAGVSLKGVSLDALSHHVPLGVALGLMIGKPLGVFSFSWLAVKLGFATLPDAVNFKQIFAVSVLCGIGFTMSIFISALAFGEMNPHYDNYARLGILVGSTTAALVGYLLLNLCLPKKLSD